LEKKAIFWFRNDFRLDDNIGLYHALNENDIVIPTYIIESKIFNSYDTSTARIFLLCDSIKDLAENLDKVDSHLIIRLGDPTNELLQLLYETGAKTVYFNKSYEPDEIEKVLKISKVLQNEGFELKSFKDSVIFEEKEIISNNKTVFKNFKNYKKKWLSNFNLEQCKQVDIGNNLSKFSKDKNIFTQNTPNPKDYGFELENKYFLGGETNAKNEVEKILAQKLFYLDDLFKLFIYLRFGNISIRKILNFLDQIKNNLNENSYLSIFDEVIKIDFYNQLLLNEPNIFEKKDLNEDMRWTNKHEIFFAWCNGKTGYPVIDAIMKKLNLTYWINNNEMDLVANFLIKNLSVNWKWGEKYFMHKLINASFAENIGKWKEIFDSKTEKFDSISKGKDLENSQELIRKYLPELENLPERYIYEPYKMPTNLQKKMSCLIGIDYPLPIDNYDLTKILLRESI